ncbi:MAG: hypothetical protein IJB70_11360 [Clostridia bacterium]|nr:hypothetical protein [Clostridia bacterium]
MKKLLALCTTAAIIASSVLTASSADRGARQPDVFVDNEIVTFADQNAYITDEGRTLVPARGVFEAMDCTVDWNAENYTVTVSNEELKKEILLTIDDTAMRVVTDGKEETKTLEVPATLMNDRTMIPLRAVSEALGCEVNWDGDTYRVDIESVKPEKEYAPLTSKIYLKAPTGTVRVGDTVAVPVVISDAIGLKGAMFKVTWDPKQLELAGTKVQSGKSFDGFTDVSDLFKVVCDVNTSGASAGYVTVAGSTLEVVTTESKDYQLGILHFKVLADAKGKNVSLAFDTTDLKTSGNNGEVNLSFASAEGTSFHAKEKLASGGGGGGSSRPSSGSGSGGSGSGSTGGTTKPDEPDVPDTPDVPDVPDVPDEPDIPDEPEIEEPEVDPMAIFTLGTISGVAGETVTVDLTFEALEDVNIIALISATLSDEACEIIGFEFSDEAKEVINTGLSNYDPATRSVVVLFNEHMQFSGTIGTFTIKLSEDASGEITISATSNAINEGVGNVASSVVEGKIEL